MYDACDSQVDWMAGTLGSLPDCLPQHIKHAQAIAELAACPHEQYHASSWTSPYQSSWGLLASQLNAAHKAGATRVGGVPHIHLEAWRLLLCKRSSGTRSTRGIVFILILTSRAAIITLRRAGGTT